MISKKVIPHIHYRLEARNAAGALLWVEEMDNLVTTVGQDNLLDTYFGGSAYTAAWYMGLLSSGALAATDTMASHPGWTEITTITSGTRPAIAWSPASGGNKSVWAPVSFTASGPATVYGAFVVSDPTLGGTAGVLYSEGNFSTSRALAAGDVLNVIPTLSV